MTTTLDASGFQGASVVVFESRMGEAMAKGIASRGGAVISAPAMREVPLAANQEAFAFGERLLAGRIDVVICLTGVGVRMLLEALATRYPLARLIEAFSRTTIVARGPKPIRVLNEFKIPVTITVPEPNTWRELIQALDLSDRGVDLGGKTVAIQEYGVSNEPLAQALQERGAAVLRVPVYRWALPEDVAPLRGAIRSLIEGRAQVALFTNAAQAHHLLRVASEQGREAPLRAALQRVVVASIGPTTSQALQACGLPVDFEPTHPKMGPLIEELSRDAQRLLQRKRRAPVDRAEAAHPAPAAAQEARALRREAPFLQACRRQPSAVTPVWLMRQAGRFLKSYREIRNRVPFLELCKTPELVADVTTMAVNALGVDAAILFSDILLIVEPLGLRLEYSAQDGPVISGAVASGADVDRLAEIEPEASLRFVFDGVRQTRSALPDAIPLIGFSGAPFTLASYIIEGGSSTSFVATKRLLYTDPGAWHALLEKLSRGLIKYLNGQIDAGADAVQLFDTWVGCLGPSEYRTFVLPHAQAVIRGLRPEVPVIYFGTGTSAFLPELAATGAGVIGVDFRVELDAAWRTIGYDHAIQGNLDPAALFAPPERIREQAVRILAQAGGRPGHIFNLGHGVLPGTPEDHVRALVDMVHELSRRG